ncbi:MAG: metallophosphoesterase [Planctomycetes bacterium]|nr:metallophosphoesterase [Planctomycetota bacterium]
MMPSNRSLCVLLTAAIFALLLSDDVSSAEERSDFTVVVLPDTQFYSQTYPDTYISQTRWIKDRAKADNIKFVVHLGDIVQNHNNVEEEWKAADRAHQILDGVVPYSLVPGNHDMEYVDRKVLRNTRLYNKYFSPARFDKYPWYGGHMGDTNDSNYCFFEAAGMKFMVLSLEFAPRDETLQWAHQVTAQHSDCRVIVVTHCYMRPNGRDTACGASYGLADNSGQDIWEKFVRKHADIFLVLSGHVLGVATETSANDAGRPVHEMLVDYQGLPNGGNGWLRTLRFAPAENKIYVKAYSPLLDEHKKDPSHTFTLDYDMKPVSVDSQKLLQQ